LSTLFFSSPSDSSEAGAATATEERKGHAAAETELLYRKEREKSKGQ
jgi:hypothetical protein